MEKKLPPGWKLLASEYLYREDWLTVRKEKLALPNGHIIPKYFVLEYPDWVNTIALTDTGQYVLVKQYRHAIGTTALELCAGVVEGHETDPLAAAQRELLEEMGYGGGVWECLMRFAPNPATSTNWVHCYVARGVSKLADANPEKSEDLTVHLCSEQELRQLMQDGSIIQGTHLAPLWRHFADGSAAP